MEFISSINREHLRKKKVASSAFRIYVEVIDYPICIRQHLPLNSHQSYSVYESQIHSVPSFEALTHRMQ